jgi:hypothetical protein
MAVRTLRSSVHLQLFEECVASYIDYKMDQFNNNDVVILSRSDFNIQSWIDEFIEYKFSDQDLDDDYKLIIGDDYLRSIEVYTYMIDYIHDCREDLYDNVEILGDYNEIFILQQYIYFYCITKHMNTLVSRVTEKVNEIRNR